MRKVLYSLNAVDPQRSGIFHCWGGLLDGSFAFIEDTETGKMHKLYNERLFRFVQPPELRKHKNDVDPGMEDYIYKLIMEKKPFDTLDKVVDLLESIHKQMTSL